MKFRYILIESKEDIDAFIKKFGKEAYDTFNKYKSSIPKKLKNEYGDPVTSDITWHTKHTAEEEMEGYINLLLNRDIEGDSIPEPTNTKELILDKDGEKLYKVYDYEDMIELSEGTGDGRMQFEFGNYQTGWCIGGRYDIPFGQVKVSQAEYYFYNYLHNNNIDFYYVLVRNDGLKFCVIDGDKFIITDHDDNEITDPDVLGDYFPECTKKLQETAAPFIYTGSNVVPKLISSVIVSDDVEVVDAEAFSDHKQIRTVDMPNVTEISDFTFADCASLETVNMPNVMFIGDNAFWWCNSLETANMPNVDDIGAYAFKRCTALKTVDMPNVKKIGVGAFQDCWRIENIDMSNVIEIGRGAFNQCVSLEWINMPNVKKIGRDAFLDCPNLTIHCSKDNEYVQNYCKENNIPVEVI